ncbi:hypothetical protein HPB48_023322 [Haemaphysalis longicornis]|uniref:TIR domain-containing protein n=1 Tax=Haemaphysalis longicornis TaxID=44386 RepID=A0A9J6H517_HAELO|nr:hypothetical protein HPB48_023322 [Haemaphysalis longicornis]
MELGQKELCPSRTVFTLLLYGIPFLLHQGGRRGRGQGLRRVRLFSNKDREWVYAELLPKVEQHGFSVCTFDRNFMGGFLIQDIIQEAVSCSRRTIAVLTQNHSPQLKTESVTSCCSECLKDLGTQLLLRAGNRGVSIVLGKSMFLQAASKKAREGLRNLSQPSLSTVCKI